jgi:RNase P subunit RPR2
MSARAEMRTCDVCGRSFALGKKGVAIIVQLQSGLKNVVVCDECGSVRRSANGYGHVYDIDFKKVAKMLDEDKKEATGKIT